MSFTGLVIKESLQDESVLEELEIVAIEHWKNIPDHKSFQPARWTAITFQGDYSQAESLAQTPSLALKARWYCNYTSRGTVYVIFGGRIFCYAEGDAVRHAEAKAYGPTLGIPERQLNWGEGV